MRLRVSCFREKVASHPRDNACGRFGCGPLLPQEKTTGRVNHAGISGTAIVGADPDAVLCQRDRVRDRAPGARQHHRHDARAERRRRRQAVARPADRRARPRPADVAAIFQLDRRHPAARRFRPLAVAEHAGARAAGRPPAGHLRARPAGDDRGAADRDPDRRLFGDPAGHRRRLPHALVLDPDAGGAELLDGHHGDGVSLDLVGLVAGGEVRRLHAKTRCRTSSR